MVFTVYSSQRAYKLMQVLLVMLDGSQHLVGTKAALAVTVVRREIRIRGLHVRMFKCLIQTWDNNGIRNSAK
jgi:hypothetical protein